MMFFDSHSHLHDSRILNEIHQVIERARHAGVKYMATCATMESNFELTRNLADRYPELIPHFGIHPWFINTLSPQWKENLQKYLESVPSAMGEIGLDFVDKKADRELQTEVFEYQLELAVEMGRPVNMHNRKAWDSLIHILKRFGKLKIPGLIHSYSGSADMIPIFEKHNLYISFSGAATNPGSKKVIKSLKAVSKDRFVLETDAPDIQPYINGQRLEGLNEPCYLKDIASVTAHRLGRDETDFIRMAFENSVNLFGTLLPERIDES